MLSQIEFAALTHYRALFSNPVFWEVAKNTLLFSSLQVIFSVLAGLGCALVANRGSGPLFKTAVLYPYLLPWSAAAMMWMYMLHPTRGIVNALLGMRIQWLNDFQLTLPVLACIAAWKTTGFSFLLFLAGLQNIPRYLYDSFLLESSSRPLAFRHITLPMLGPAFFAALLLSIAGSFQSADIMYAATQGRPGNASNVLVYYIYQQGIARRNIGYGSALSTILFLAMMTFTVCYILWGEKKIQYDA
jgi:ABC-type sugar transport system permease subunit